MTYREYLKEAEARLQAAGVPDAAWDAWYLLSEVTGMSRASYFLDQNRPMAEDMKTRLDEMIMKREQRIPLQHLTGWTEFMGLPFQVNEHVLIPRQDTEKLVELVLEDEKIHHPKRVLDMCTGSGCIAVSLSVLGHFQEVIAVDISTEALKVAVKNGADNDCSNLKFLESDLFEALEEERFDRIVSNPPYIRSAEIEELMPEVRDHDPRLALDGMEDGLYFYRKLAEECPRHLNPGGKIYWEIGWDQGQEVSDLLKEAGFGSIEVIPDDTGKDRVITGEWKCLTD